MITGELRSKVDSIWDTIWTGGITSPIIVSLAVVTLAVLQIFDIWTQAINLCIPLMGVNLLCQTYMQWNTSRKTAYFSLGCAVFVFACTIAVFFIK